MVNQIKAYFDMHREELIGHIMDAIRIPSVNGPAEEGAPFGKECARALKQAMALAESFGLKTTVFANKVGAVDLNDGPAGLDILAHLDVVPPGEDWKISQPFSPIIQDGKLYGRGACDDKGPAIAALYALRAVHDLGIPLKCNARLILGTDEETACRDIEYYYTQCDEAPFSFSPDGEYPVINIEKGGLYTAFSSTWEDDSTVPRIRSIDGGTVGNAIPGTAQAILEGLSDAAVSEAAQNVSRMTGVKFSVSPTEGEALIKIQAFGVPAHASTPEEGCNALNGLLTLLCSLPLSNDTGMCKIRGLSELFPFGEHYGQKAGIAQEDEVSGRLTLTMNVLHFSQGRLEGRIDCRAPLCANKESVLEPLRKRLMAYDIELPENCEMTPSHYVPEDLPQVQTLLQCYEQVFGMPGHCVAIGGGTYVHRLKNGVAFGASMPNTDYHMHGADEFLVCDEIVKSAELFALTICRLCGDQAVYKAQN